jgi:hypothetical protein
MRGTLHVDFEESTTEQTVGFSFMLVCVDEQQIKTFNDYYQYGYVAFWVYCNLVLQIYHRYPCDLSHAVLFLAYLLASFLIDQPLVAYSVAALMLFLVLLRERKESRVNTRVFSLYLTFMLLALLLVLFSSEAESGAAEWNLVWIALDNFVTLHITMFMVLRLLQVRRLRHVVWYFLAVAGVAVLSEGSPNSYFTLNFQNIYNLECLRAELFFPLMMLPISCYFTSLTWWIHRVIALVIVLCSLLPLSWSIKTMAVVLTAVLLYHIKHNGVESIKHRL